jgi:hypothetical protein
MAIYFFDVVNQNEMLANNFNFRILKTDQSPDIFCSLIKGYGTKAEIQSAREFFWTKLLLYFSKDLKYLTIDQIDELKKFINNGSLRSYPVKVDYNDGRLITLPLEYRPFLTIKPFNLNTVGNTHHNLKTTIFVCTTAVLIYSALKCI